jgi:hypothetical protein
MLVPFENLRIVVDGEPVQRLGALWLGLGLGVGASW